MPSSRSKLIVLYIISFLLGAGTAVSARRVLSILMTPKGSYVYLLNQSGFEYHLLKLSESNDIHEFWVHEKRSHPFQSESGLISEVLYSKVLVDCNQFASIIVEQRAFSKEGNYLTRNDSIVRQTSASVSAHLAMMEACISRT